MPLIFLLVVTFYGEGRILILSSNEISVRFSVEVVLFLLSSVGIHFSLVGRFKPDRPSEVYGRVKDAEFKVFFSSLIS